MRNQVPRGPEDMDCPWHRKSMDKVCHKCPMWVKISIEQHPQNNKEGVDDWNCSLAWGPIMAVKMSNHLVQVGSEMHEMRNEVKKAQDEQVAMAAIAVQRSRDVLVDSMARLSNGELPIRDVGKIVGFDRPALLNAPSEA